MKAPRAGTPGFRAPEVLLKYKYQNTGKQKQVLKLYSQLEGSRYSLLVMHNDIVINIKPIFPISMWPNSTKYIDFEFLFSIFIFIYF